MKMLQKKVKSLAIKSLRKCYYQNGIYAGLHQFKDYWARDSFYASLGALEIRDLGIVRKNLELFLRFEKKGKIPLRIGNRFLIQTVLGIRGKKLFPKYNDDKKGSFCSDSNTLFLIVFARYIQVSKDKQFAIKHLPKIIKIITNLKRYSDENLLINEDYYSTWMDAIKKRGYIFYSNLLYFIALKIIYEIYSEQKMEIGFDENYIKKLSMKINDTFWKYNHFTDWIGNNDADYFDTFSNLLAIYFGFASKSKSKKILSFIKEKNLINQQGAIKKSFPNYSEKLISKRIRLLGLKSYCTSIYYPAMCFFYFVCLKKTKFEDKKSDLQKNSLLSRVLSQKKIFEAWDFRFNPYSEIFYYSEHPFAWACSFLILLTNTA
ncbi:MAG TPA: amylo-alpha-1,6-glucosidase [Candidatus Woesearchaeota archaeon]|nr:amylo-alpha-1,6-glucosidase [Candidatus Woesearchaeota archaeon]